MDRPERLSRATGLIPWLRERWISTSLTVALHLLLLFFLVYTNVFKGTPGDPGGMVMMALSVNRATDVNTDAVVRPRMERPVVPLVIAPSIMQPPPMAEMRAMPVVNPFKASRGESTYLAEVWLRILSNMGQGNTSRAVNVATMKGVVIVHIIIDKSGWLVLSEIAKSSGNPELDADALEVIDHTQPFPELPLNVGDYMSTNVPIGYGGAPAMKVYQDDYNDVH